MDTQSIANRGEKASFQAGELLLQPTVHTVHRSAVKMQHSIPTWGTECPWQLPVSRVQGTHSNRRWEMILSSVSSSSKLKVSKKTL